MLCFVIFYFSGGTQTGAFSDFYTSLQSEGISASVLPFDSVAESNVFLQDSLGSAFKKALISATLPDSEAGILVTDSPAAAVLAKELGIACIGITGDSSVDVFPFSCLLWESLECASVTAVKMFHAHYHHYPAKILETEQFTVREFAASDAHSLFLLKSQPSMLRFMDEVLLDERSEAEKLSAYINNAYPFYELALWGIFEKQSGNLIGRIGFMPVDEDSFIKSGFNFSVGYMIDEHFRGLGYVTKALASVLALAEEFGQTRILCRIKKENTASFRVLSHCGYPYQVLFQDADLVTFGISTVKIIKKSHET